RVLEEIFAVGGGCLRDEVELVRLDPQYELVFGGGGRMRATPHRERLKQEVASICPADAQGVDRFLDETAAKFARFRPVLESSFSGWRDLLRPSLVRLLPWLRPWNSLDRELRRYFSDPRVRLAFSFQSKYLGMSPLNCPSLFSILSFLEYEYGVFHPLGGCGAVTEAMARLARRLGVEIAVDEPVEQLLFSGSRAVGLRTPTGEYRADAVVVNADFARAMERLVPNRLRPRWTDAKLARKRYSCSTFMLYLGLDGREDELAHHTIFLAEDYERNLREIEVDHVLSANPSFYVQNPCVTDPSLAPPGGTSLYVLVPVTHQHPHVDWSRRQREYRDLVIRQLAKIGIRDVEKRLRFERMVTPADWDVEHQIYRGATFNLAHNLGQLLHLRPRNRFEGVPGLYLVGGGTHPGSGLPVIFESARITSRLLLEDLDLPYTTLDAVALAPSPDRERGGEFQEVLAAATALSTCLRANSTVVPESL
ncbi:MAG: phytoene desaturase, partial [Planctomycetaceae bacterium]|nr:phytoene desaturase [Planctomycetaceae bacterium]